MNHSRVVSTNAILDCGRMALQKITPENLAIMVFRLSQQIESKLMRN